MEDLAQGYFLSFPVYTVPLLFPTAVSLLGYSLISIMQRQTCPLLLDSAYFVKKKFMKGPLNEYVIPIVFLSPPFFPPFFLSFIPSFLPFM